MLVAQYRYYEIFNLLMLAHNDLADFVKKCLECRARILVCACKTLLFPTLFSGYIPYYFSCTSWCCIPCHVSCQIHPWNVISIVHFNSSIPVSYTHLKLPTKRIV